MTGVGPVAQRLIELMYQALAAKIGIAVSSANPGASVAAFCQARAAAADPTLAELRVMVSPREPSHEVWLVKGVKDLTLRSPAKRVTKVDDEIVRALGLDDISED